MPRGTTWPHARMSQSAPKGCTLELRAEHQLKLGWYESQSAPKGCTLERFRNALTELAKSQSAPKGCTLERCHDVYTTDTKLSQSAPKGCTLERQRIGVLELQTSQSAPKGCTLERDLCQHRRFAACLNQPRRAALWNGFGCGKSLSGLVVSISPEGLHFGTEYERMRRESEKVSISPEGLHFGTLLNLLDGLKTDESQSAPKGCTLERC